MTALGEFLDMGGYGAFVWPSYGISVVILVALFVISLRQLKKVENDLKPLEQNRRSRRRKKTDKEAEVL